MSQPRTVEMHQDSAGSRDNSRDGQLAGESVQSMLEQCRSEHMACKTTIDDSRRQAAMLDDEVARLERELAVATAGVGDGSSNGAAIRAAATTRG